ncbi:hypothetical protein [Azospirillum largimobile]
MIRIAASGAGEVIAQGGSAPSAPDDAHQARSLDVDELAAAVEIEEPAGLVLASLIRIAAGMPARWRCRPSRDSGRVFRPLLLSTL